MNQRSMRTFWYALYNTTVEDETDEYGNSVNPYTTYGNPIEARGNISPAKGEVMARMFGDDDLYDKVVTVSNSQTPINEYAILWIDTVPVINADGSTNTPHDYIVKKVARGLDIPGSANIAVSKVSVSNPPEPVSA